MVVTPEHLHLQVVADSVYQVYFEERLSADKVPNDTFLAHILLMVEDVVNSLFCHLPRHPLFRVLPYEVAIFTGKLAVLCDDESDVLGNT